MENYIYRNLLFTFFTFLILFGCKTENRKLTLSIMETMTFDKIRGWGHAVVIQTPDGHTYMFDTGQNYPDTDFDCGKDMIAPFLLKNNIKEIDGIVISHSHNDHFGGFQYLMNNFKIKQLYDSGLPVIFTSDTEYDKVYKPEYIDKGGNYMMIKQGDTLNWGKDLEVVILSPPTGYLDDELLTYNDPALHHNPNLNSIVLRLKYKNVVFLFLGDLNSNGQNYLLKNYSAKELKADVLCLAHGGAFSDFAEVVKPEIVVVSCLNGVEHPANEAKKIYNQVGSVVYATCWNGTLQVVSDGDLCSVISEHNQLLNN